MANQEAFTLDGLALNDGTTFGSIRCRHGRRRGSGRTGSAPPTARRSSCSATRCTRTARSRSASRHPAATMDLAHDKIALVLDKLQKASKYTDGIAS
jgi:hypothetical protein